MTRKAYGMGVSRGVFVRKAIGNIAEMAMEWGFLAGPTLQACLPDQLTSGQPCGPGGGARIHQTPSPSTPAESAESLDNVTPARGVGVALVVMIASPELLD